MRVHRAAVVVVLVAVACGDGDALKPSPKAQEVVCVPGSQASCPCTIGYGIRVCNESGTAYTSCLGCDDLPGTGGAIPGLGGQAGAPAGGAGAAGTAAVAGMGGIGGGVGGGTQDCCQSATTPGCSDPMVQACLCSMDPYCCAEKWDEDCVARVTTSGCGTCGNPGTGGTAGTGGVGGGGPGGAGGGHGESPPPADPPPDTELAAGIRITQIASFQTVKVKLMEAGIALQERNAPVVEGRRTLLRVYVEPLPGFQNRDLIARLDLESSMANVRSRGVKRFVSGGSSDADLNSTFNFDLPWDEMTADLRYSVSIHEAQAGSGGPADPAVSWPINPGELIPLAPAPNPGKFRITIVPFRYQADGSGRMPDVSPEQMDRYFNIMLATYPTGEIELSLRDPVDYFNYVSGGSGWSTWLDTLCDVRSNDGVDPKNYYFGVMAMATGWGQYGGGIVGLGNVPSADGNWGRCAVGVGFPDGDTNGFTYVHEVGHTLGRPHAPCGVSGGYFPYPGAVIGVWGYSRWSNNLKDPNQFVDFMSYCDPQWISDYNYQKLYERISYVNANYKIVPMPPTKYRKVLVHRDGSITWGGTVTMNLPPGGEPREVTEIDGNGQPVGTISGHWFPFSEKPAGALLVPEPAASVQAIRPVAMPELPLVQR